MRTQHLRTRKNAKYAVKQQYLPTRILLSDSNPFPLNFSLFHPNWTAQDVLLAATTATTTAATATNITSSSSSSFSVFVQSILQVVQNFVCQDTDFMVLQVDDTEREEQTNENEFYFPNLSPVCKNKQLRDGQSMILLSLPDQIVSSNVLGANLDASNSTTNTNTTSSLIVGAGSYETIEWTTWQLNYLVIQVGDDLVDQSNLNPFMRESQVMENLAQLAFDIAISEGEMDSLLELQADNINSSTFLMDDDANENTRLFLQGAKMSKVGMEVETFGPYANPPFAIDNNTTIGSSSTTSSSSSSSSSTADEPASSSSSTSTSTATSRSTSADSLNTDYRQEGFILRSIGIVLFVLTVLLVGMMTILAKHRRRKSELESIQQKHEKGGLATEEGLNRILDIGRRSSQQRQQEPTDDNNNSKNDTHTKKKKKKTELSSSSTSTSKSSSTKSHHSLKEGNKKRNTIDETGKRKDDSSPMVNFTVEAQCTTRTEDGNNMSTTFTHDECFSDEDKDMDNISVLYSFRDDQMTTITPTEHFKRRPPMSCMSCGTHSTCGPNSRDGQSLSDTWMDTLKELLVSTMEAASKQRPAVTAPPPDEP